MWHWTSQETNLFVLRWWTWEMRKIVEKRVQCKYLTILLQFSLKCEVLQNQMLHITIKMKKFVKFMLTTLRKSGFYLSHVPNTERTSAKHFFNNFWNFSTHNEKFQRNKKMQPLFQHKTNVIQKSYRKVSC